MRGEINTEDLKLKKKFEEDISYTEKWWKKKAIRRYKNINTQQRIKKDQLFYWDVIDMSWEVTKHVYLTEVGR